MKIAGHQEYFDIFVSYRRDGGSAIASLLKQRLLSDPSLSIFLDVEEIGSGDWANRIETSLVNSSNFLFLFTPGSLNRCFSDPENDVVFREMRKACEIRSHCENTPEMGGADSRFRIIPIFLGEKIENICDYHKATHPHVVEIIHSFIRHNGISLTDASSIESELSKLSGLMLLKRTGKFANTLIEKTLSNTNNLLDKRAVEGLEELFSCYLSMFEPSEYLQARLALLPLVQSRLMKVLESERGEHFDDKLKTFNLGVLKATCAARISPTAAHGSRSRVVKNAEKWLRGEVVEPFTNFKEGSEVIDRSLRIGAYFTEFVSKHKYISRSKLAEVIKARTGPGLDFRFFSPENWKRYQSISAELFERMTYSQICLEFINFNWRALQKDSVARMTPAEKAKRRGFLDDLQKFIWGRIKEDYPHIEDLPRNASIRTYINAIESFISYADGFAFCESDCKSLVLVEEVDSSEEPADDRGLDNDEGDQNFGDAKNVSVGPDMLTDPTSAL